MRGDRVKSHASPRALAWVGGFARANRCAPAIAAIKRAKVVEAVADGAIYEQAAQQAGYASRSGALQGVLEGRRRPGTPMPWTSEVQRLDALQVAVWEKAMAGDLKAILAVLRIIEHRSRLLGLDKPGAWKAEPETVVLSPAQLARWKATQGADT